MVLLEANKLFCDLKPADLDRLHKVVREISYEPSQVIFKEGDAGDGVFLSNPAWCKSRPWRATAIPKY